MVHGGVGPAPEPCFGLSSYVICALVFDMVVMTTLCFL